MVGVIVGSKKTGVNPDNVATPIAASFGDLITLAILAWISQGLYKCLGGFTEALSLLCMSSFGGRVVCLCREIERCQASWKEQNEMQHFVHCRVVGKENGPHQMQVKFILSIVIEHSITSAFYTRLSFRALGQTSIRLIIQLYMHNAIKG